MSKTLVINQDLKGPLIYGINNLSGTVTLVAGPNTVVTNRSDNNTIEISGISVGGGGGGAGGAWALVERKVLVADTAGPVVFSTGINGDTHEEYEIRIFGHMSGNSKIHMYPNGNTSAQSNAGYQTTSGAGPSNIANDNRLRIGRGETDNSFIIVCRFFAGRPSTMAADRKVRYGYSTCTMESLTNEFTFFRWQNTTDNVTSIEFALPDGGNFKTGSRFEIWKKVT